MRSRTIVTIVSIFVLVSLLVTSCQLPGAAPKIVYPSGPIKVIVPRAAGGSNDVIARLMANYLQKYIGQPVVVENVPEGGGVVGVDQVTKAKADGYTLLFSTPTTDILKQVVEGTAYDYKKLVGVYNIGGGDSNIISVNATSDVKTLKDFVAKAKASGVTIGRLTGLNVTNYALAFLVDVCGIPPEKITTVPYDDGKQPALAVAGGHIDAVLNQRVDIISLVQDGRLRPLVIFTKARNPNLPDLQTFQEIFPGADNYYEINQGLMAPAGTPAEVIQVLNDALDKAVVDPEYVTKAKSIFSPSPMNSKIFAGELAKMWTQADKAKSAFAKFVTK